MACLFGGKSIKAAKEKGAPLLTVKEAQDAGIAGIDITLRKIIDKTTPWHGKG